MATDTPITLDLLAKELKALRKDVRKIRQHIEDPTGEKQAARAQNNGFNKPLDVTPELRSFLKLGPDEKISRSQVTTRINAYVTEKGLKAGQNISLDDSLKSLLNPPEGTQITFLNIQKYINPHYIKEVKPKVEKVPKVKKEKAAETSTPTGITTPAESVSDAPKEKKMRPKVAKPAATTA
jgi:upstream activation factor subunit UAF30